MSATRRTFLRTAAAGAGAATFLPARLSAGPGPNPSATPETTAATASRKALATHHRSLFNGDTCVFFYNPELWQPEDFTLAKGESIPRGGPFKAKAIHRYVDTLADSGIDTFVINANASRAWYPSKVIPSILEGYRRGDREFFRGHAICAGATKPGDVEAYLDRAVQFFNLYQDLLDAGVDWLAETAKACRRRRIAPWVSIRMNDFHGQKNIDGSFFNVPLLKNPEMRLKRGAYSPTMRDPAYRGALNYEKREVRELMAAQIREVVDDYDFDGLELDWLRNPNCCEPHATPETVAMMTGWLREIRALTERRAKATGRPYPLGMRIPGRLETLKSIGLDLVTLCREGTLDFVCPSGFWHTSWEMPHDHLRRVLGDRVAIYGVIEDGINPLPAVAPQHTLTSRLRYTSASVETLRANAAGKLVLGADGLEWYNFFCTDQARLPGFTSNYAVMRSLDRLEPLRGLPKHYSFSIWGNFLTQYPFEITPQLPVKLAAGWSHGFRLPMCSEPVDRGLELIIQIVLESEDTFTCLPVAINGCWPRLENKRTQKLLFPSGSLSEHTRDHAGYDFSFPVTLIRDGWNEIVVENGGASTITVKCIDLAVRPASLS